MSASSSISATDVELFKRLANPAVVDVQSESRARRATIELRNALEKAARAAAPQASEPAAPPASESAAPRASEPAAPHATSPESVEASPASSGFGERKRSSFRIAQEAAAAQEEEHRTRDRLGAEDLERQRRPAGQQEAGQQAGQQAGPPRPEPPAPVPAARVLTAPPRAKAPPPEQESTEEADRSSNEDAPQERASSRRGSEEERLEKQSYLIELATLKQKGVVLSRQFDMKDSVAELEFEVQRQHNGITTRHNVAFMRDMMRIVINGMEIGNNRFGPFLSIDGWAESVTQDMAKYEHVLERLYKRYWRKSQLSPVMELAWLLVGSMIAWHFKSKFFGPPAPAQASGPTVQHREVPVGRHSSVPTRSRAAGRPSTARAVLRPPSALFGL